MDSLRPDRYARITGGGSLEKVLAGIDEALAAGFVPLKLNAVLLRGQNDDEVDDFIALTKDRSIHVRFIEWMPLGENDQADLRVTGAELLQVRPYLTPVPPMYESQPSRDYQVPGHNRPRRVHRPRFTPLLRALQPRPRDERRHAAPLPGRMQGGFSEGRLGQRG